MDKLIAGESYTRFAERLEHAARMTWRLAHTDTENRERLIRTSRNLGVAAQYLRNEDR